MINARMLFALVLLYNHEKGTEGKRNGEWYADYEDTRAFTDAMIDNGKVEFEGIGTLHYLHDANFRYQGDPDDFRQEEERPCSLVFYIMENGERRFFRLDGHMTSYGDVTLSGVKEVELSTQEVVVFKAFE